MVQNKDKYKYFRIEARELLEGLNQGVLELERGSRGKDLVGRILRFAHALKGAAGVVKQPGIAELAHSIEDAFAAYREEPDAVSPERINQAFGLLDAAGARVAALDLPAEAAEATPRLVVEE